MSSISLNPDNPIEQDVTPSNALSSRSAIAKPTRWVLLGFGWLNVTLGIIGAFLPLMPTTIFLIIALWCFTKSSPKLAHWLYTHPKFGRVLQDWHTYRVVPLHAKVTATVLMLTSLALVFFSNTGSYLLVIVLAAAIAAVLAYLLSRPHERPVVREE